MMGEPGSSLKRGLWHVEVVREVEVRQVREGVADVPDVVGLSGSSEMRHVEVRHCDTRGRVTGDSDTCAQVRIS